MDDIYQYYRMMYACLILRGFDKDVADEIAWKHAEEDFK